MSAAGGNIFVIQMLKKECDCTEAEQLYTFTEG